jgi:hypothetical protein
MGSEKKAGRPQAQTSDGLPPRKRYVKPSVRRLGSVRELTHGHPSVFHK